MARNDVFLNINALSPADAVVTGQQDMTAATVPELVLGDTPTFNFYFTDNTNVWPSWAGNAAYTVTWALSDAVSGDFSPAATTGNATPITGGWSVVLPLNAYDLVGLLNTKRVSQPYPVTNLWQQIRVADPSGNEITRAMFWTPVRYRAISDTQNTESASPTGGREVTVDNVNVLTTPTAAQFYAANPVPTSALGSAANGELLIGNGTGFTKSTLTAGTGITVTNGSGSITIDASGAQETLTATVKNAESVAITKGQVVYLFGATGNMPSVKLAYNTSDATSAKTFGVVSDTSISPNGTGTVTCVGVVDGLNLGAYQDGDTVYLGATPGSITATKPYAPNHLVYVGIVERANAGNGELYVRVQNGYELDEIHDVQINSPRQSGQTLIYDNTTSLWKNARITAGSNIAVTNGDGSISIGFSGTLPVANGGTGVTTSTGSGSVVLSTSPTLTTPILGTPQSGTLSSCTGLPISTGVSGLGTNVATFLATPSSANLASAVTDETGTGALVFANTPTLTTPNIGAATGTSFNLTGSGTLGTTLTVNGTTDSSSKDTGAIVTEGGLGVEKSATIGGNLTVSGATSTITLGSTNTASIAVDSNGGLTVTPKSGQYLNIAGGLSVTENVCIVNRTSSGAQVTNVMQRSGVNKGLLGLTAANDPAFVTTLDGITPNFTVADATGNVTARGNLTVSGTGTSSVAGSLGIGTTSPTRPLDVRGSLGMQVNEDNAGTKVISIRSDFASAGPAINVTTNDPLLFLTNNSERARITSSGNFLIGTTTDGGQKLQVSGTGYFSGNVGIGANAANRSLEIHNASTPAVVLRNTGQGTDQKSWEFSVSGNVLRGAIENDAFNTEKFWLEVTRSSSSLSFDSVKLNTGAGTTALTLDSSQNATFAGTSLTIDGASTGSTLTLKRASNANGAIISYKTTTTSKWYHGLRGLVDDNWYLQNDVAGNTALFFDASTSNATFGGTVTLPNDKAIYFKEVGGTAQRFALNSGDVIYIEPDQLHKISIGGAGVTNVGAGGIGVAGNSVFNGSIAIGNTVNTVSPTSPNRTITMVIGGTTYYIHAKTTND